MYILEEVTEIRNVSPRLSLLKVIVSGVEYKTFMNYRDALTLLGQEIMCTFTSDIIDGVESKVIREVAKKQVINVIETNKRVKLYEEISEYCKSNINFLDIKETEFGCLVYCIKSEYKKSAKSDWVQCQIMDKSGRIDTLYWFEVLPGKEIDFAGNYLRGTLTRTRFGFSAQDLDVVPDVALGENPDITLAVDYLNQVFNEYEDIKIIIDKHDFLSAARYYLDENEPEPGYVLVRLASEIYMASVLDDISPIVSKDLLIKALFARRLYVLTNTDTNPRSKELQNILVVAKHPMGKDKQLMHLLDVTSTPILPEVSIIKSISDMVDNLISMRRFNTILKPYTHKFWEELK